MSKYTPLKEYLENSNKTTEVLTFQELEIILGFPLPDSASTHRPWWANGGHSQANAWLEAGWKVESVSLGFNVIFSKETNSGGYRKTQEHKKSAERENLHNESHEKLYNTPQEIFAYFNCPYPCGENQLRKAYLEIIKRNHPDKVDGLDRDFRELAEKKTKEINKMYDKALSYYLKG